MKVFTCHSVVNLCDDQPSADNALVGNPSPSLSTSSCEFFQPLNIAVCIKRCHLGTPIFFVQLQEMAFSGWAVGMGFGPSPGSGRI